MLRCVKREELPVQLLILKKINEFKKKSNPRNILITYYNYQVGCLFLFCHVLFIIFYPNS